MKRLLISLTLLLAACGQPSNPLKSPQPSVANQPVTTPINNPTLRQLVAGGVAQVQVTTSYDPAYVALAYPGGDVSQSTGVCTDVIIRAYRKIGVDLQQKVHQDMTQNFRRYPQLWGLQKPDANIDHRRVANLMTFFRRNGQSLPVSQNLQDYQPGDIVTYDLGSIGLHIALVTNVREGNSYQLVHNACCGAKVETLPPSWKINGHYRYLPSSQ